MLKRLNLLYLNNFIRGLAFSFFGIFIPIYFLTLGFSLQSVFIYFLILQTTTFLSFFLGNLISKKIGYKGLIITSTIFVLLFLFLLRDIGTSNFPIYLLAIIAGIKGGFYYLPMHGFFSNLSEKGKKGTQLSNFMVFGQISGMIGPLIGAFIVIFLGFSSLFSIGIIFVALSLYPLFYLKNIYPKNKIKFSNMIMFFKKNKKFFLGNILDNIEGEAHVIWPIFVFLILKNIFSVGSVGTLAALGTMIFTLFLGRHYDKKPKYSALKYGAILLALLWFSRTLFDSTTFIYVSSIVGGFFTLMVAIPFEAIFYDKASIAKNQDAFIIHREIPTFIGRLIFWIVAILVINKFIIGFILAGISVLIMSFLKFKIIPISPLQPSSESSEFLQD